MSGGQTPAAAKSAAKILRRNKIMLKDMLKTIKEDMRSVRSYRQDFQAELKEQLAEIETARKDALARDTEFAYDKNDKWHIACCNRETNKRYDSLKQKATEDIIWRYDNGQVYRFIYKDGSEAHISAREILNGAKLPRLSNIAYAEMSDADWHIDTETGELNWYSNEHMEACGWDEDVADESVFQYETAIEVKYGTEWGKRYSQEHPKFEAA